MPEETKNLSDEEMREVVERVRKELTEYVPYVEASIETLQCFLPPEFHVTIIVRKDDDTPGAELCGAMLRTNDDPKKIVRALAPMAKAVIEHPEEFK